VSPEERDIRAAVTSVHRRRAESMLTDEPFAFYVS
jgi:hypothetical protein